MARILLIDDDIELTELLSELLAMEGFGSHITHNGKDALDVLEKEHFDIVLLDVMMPVLNGIETLKQIRQKYDIPVLMLSARDDDIDRVLGLELGADDYLPKPFNDRELLARIKAILRRTEHRPPAHTHQSAHSALAFGGVELHVGKQEAYYDGKNLDLTGTEFALLQMLISHPGEIISREALTLEVLGKHLSAYDRAIDMHVSNLRKKLPERSDGLPWFKTLRGRGYLLVTD